MVVTLQSDTGNNLIQGSLTYESNAGRKAAVLDTAGRETRPKRPRTPSGERC